ncbi:MarR family winged helix-turn-helix transcriptional regulator [Amycolatopsis sp. H20-H5]|uniref:MarR family winged helix-turn-helix transcriptional regulator n=1 Tax=Amycolatopsis sp. H20-H5 TaxID=3046309 RepID=UPI002DBB1F80|nr:MarR family transcriptional regulator [Amycolatopsis sp. H20-H5]MEC3976418.1 MarR family transcriptional regulator [Amycolatopsis sp. H20-H5]
MADPQRLEEQRLDEREARVWRSYRGLGQELQAALDRQLVRDAGLSAAEYALLVPLSEASGDVLRMRDLGVRIGWDRSRLSHQARRMAKRGLLVREDCADDARGAMVRLTAAGRAAIENAAPEHVATVRRYFADPLSDEELDLLGAVFERLRDRLAADAD